MVPRRPDASSVVASSGRTPNRYEFCRQVVIRAGEIATGLVQSQDWRQIFNDTEESQLRLELEESHSSPLRDLKEAAGRLRDAIVKFQCKNRDDPFLVIVLDEGSGVLAKGRYGEPHEGRYAALNRIMSCLKEVRIWFFVLSTESKLEALLPPSNAERFGLLGDYIPPARHPPRSNSLLPPLPPFLVLQLDVEDRRRMQNGKARRLELRKPMSQFSEPKHMAMFGRPLWFAFNNAKEMNRVAELKLVGGRPGVEYNPKNEHHVFAALSFRLSLDVCMQNPEALLHLARGAVKSYMRIVLSVDHSSRISKTVTPSEPVLAVAAMQHLRARSNWRLTIGTLIHALLEKGLVENGLKGGLYSRIVLILARDSFEVAGFLRRNASISRFCPWFVTTFMVEDFLKALYAKGHHKSIATIEPVILQAKMNFTHFVPAHENLTPGVVSELCHDLLRRNAAMQLAPTQPMYDKLLPIYFGNEGEHFDPSKCGIILVQDRNKDTTTTPEQVFQEEFTISPESREKWGGVKSIRDTPYFIFDQMAKPILFLLFDMGVATAPTASSPLVQVSRSKGEATPHVWAIHSRGHTEETFGCLETMGCEPLCAKLFGATKPRDRNAHDTLVSRNETFREFSRSFRYTGFQEDYIGRETDEEGVGRETYEENAGRETDEEDAVRNG